MKAIDGRYTLRARLGEGGSAEVFQAFDEWQQRSCALKVAINSERKNTTRVLHDASVLSYLRGDGVPDVYATGTLTDGRTYYAREWIDALPLNGARASHPVDLSKSLALTHRLLTVLGRCHAKGIIHRDLKPSNILVPLVRAVPDYEKAFLIDFGSCGKLEDITGGVPRTSGRRWSGTPKYMAPEQLRGCAQTVATDLFAVGVVLFEVLFGFAPMYDTDREVTMEVQLDDRPFTFAFVPGRITDQIRLPQRPDISDAIANLLTALLARDPNDRPRTADNALDSLERAQLSATH
jgi:serine/threonine protein kinase